MDSEILVEGIVNDAECSSTLELFSPLLASPSRHGNAYKVVTVFLHDWEGPTACKLLPCFKRGSFPGGVYGKAQGCSLS